MFNQSSQEQSSYDNHYIIDAPVHENNFEILNIIYVHLEKSVL